MSPADRLLAELWPDGTFGGARPQRAPRPLPESPYTRADEQARHRAELLAALSDQPAV